MHRVELPPVKLNEPIYLIPFGDTHRFSKLCDVDKWFEFLDWAKSKPNCLFLGMGDYDDLASYNERGALASVMSSLHDDTQMTLDDIYRSRTEQLAQELSFMKGKLIGLIEGNHFAVLSNGNITTTQLLAEKLGCKYLGCSAFIRLSAKRGTSENSHCCLDIWAHHGKGASRLTGGSLNAVEQMVMIADSDIYLMGHDHRKSVAIRNKLVLQGRTNTLLANKKILMARTGSFLKGYVPDAPSYIAKAQLTPTDLGVVKIELTPRRNRKDYNDQFYLDIHASI